MADICQTRVGCLLFTELPRANILGNPHQFPVWLPFKHIVKKTPSENRTVSTFLLGGLCTMGNREDPGVGPGVCGGGNFDHWHYLPGGYLMTGGFYS
jgi:hypothetical protein